MAVLPRFDTPARLPEPGDADREAWHRADRPRRRRVRPPSSRQFFDPTATDAGADVMAPASPGSPSPPPCWKGATSAGAALGRRGRLPHRAGRVLRVGRRAGRRRRGHPGHLHHARCPSTSSTSPTRDPDRLLATYHELVGPHVELDDLVAGGRYRPDNVHNDSTQGRPAHLMQATNTLGAAVVLAAQATVLRHDADGEPVTSAMALVRCGRLGEPRRNSDPQIAAAVNDAAATGAEISLQDPLGLYLDRLLTGGLERPDGGDPAEFWTIERGTPQHTVRASFAVPAELGFRVGRRDRRRPADRVRRAARRPRRRPADRPGPAGRSPAAASALHRLTGQDGSAGQGRRPAREDAVEPVEAGDVGPEPGRQPAPVGRDHVLLRQPPEADVGDGARGHGPGHQRAQHPGARGGVQHARGVTGQEQPRRGGHRGPPPGDVRAVRAMRHGEPGRVGRRRGAARHRVTSSPTQA